MLWVQYTVQQYIHRVLSAVTFRQPSIPQAQAELSATREKAPRARHRPINLNFISTTRLSRSIGTPETRQRTPRKLVYSLRLTSTRYLARAESCKAAKMMHPARQAYVEETAEVRNSLPPVTLVLSLHCSSLCIAILSRLSTNSSG